MYGRNGEPTKTILHHPPSLLQLGKYSLMHYKGVISPPSGALSAITTFGLVFNHKRISKYLLNLPDFDLFYTKDINGGRQVSGEGCVNEKVASFCKDFTKGATKL